MLGAVLSRIHLHPSEETPVERKQYTFTFSRSRNFASHVDHHPFRSFKLNVKIQKQIFFCEQDKPDGHREL
jgi:hypothetical protein